MNLTIEAVDFDQKVVLQNLMELYQHDLSEYQGQEVDATGRYGYSYLDYYWNEAGRSAFFIRVSGQLAGFVLVNQHTLLKANEDANAIAEFFVLRKYRRLGIGSKAATEVFEQKGGRWEVLCWDWNSKGRQFWKNLLKAYKGDQFAETKISEQGQQAWVYSFENR